MFMSNLQKEVDASSLQLTENGAVGYTTTGKKLTDLNFKVATLRNKKDSDILNVYKEAYFENPELAVKWLFYARDIRGGLQEKNLFHVAFNWLLDENKNAKNLIQYIPEYGYYKDFNFINKPEYVVEIIKDQLTKDLIAMEKKKPISLLAKWMPSQNASSQGSKKLGKYFARALGMSDKNYRKNLSALRKYLDVTEVKTSKNAWSQIDYNKVSSQANMLYSKAFLKHDLERRQKHLQDVLSGKENVKINAATLFAHDIVNRYQSNVHMRRNNSSIEVNPDLEAAWMGLPKKSIENTLVVADGSGSMTSNIGGSNVTALAVANALAIYFSENNKGEFKNKYITFSNRPQFVDFTNCKTLASKVEMALRHNEVASTDIEAVFKLILKTAIKNNYTAEDMPKNILIVSDMEFNAATNGCDNDPLFVSITKEYEAKGFKLPKIIFLNVNSRTGTVPLQENENGVILVSGFSIHIADMIMSTKLDPFEALKEVLLSERYKQITIS